MGPRRRRLTTEGIMSVTLGQAIRNAIEAEESAERFYRRLQDHTKDSAARAFLDDMARQEREHAVLLIAVGNRLESAEFPDQADCRVDCIETAPAWNAVEGVDFDTALDVALEAENNAALYYDALGDSCSGEVRDFFAKLVRTEEQHAQLLRDVRAKRAERR
jgi:rubrerythrin